MNKTMNPLEMDGNSLAPSLLVAAHCMTIRRKKKRIDIQELSAILDDLFRELYYKPLNNTSYLKSMNEITDALNTSAIPSLVLLHSHYFFLLVRNSIQSLLQKSLTTPLNQQEMFVLRNCTVLLETLVKKIYDVSKLLPWINDNAFVKAVADTLTQINKMPSANHNKRLIRQIVRLVNIFGIIQERLPWHLHENLFISLLQPAVNCLTSSTYVQLFQDLKPDTKSLSSIQKLYLIKCPYFLERYNGQDVEKTTEEILEIMLPRYISILDKHITTVREWHSPMMRAIRYLLTTLVFAEGCFTLHLTNRSLRSLVDHLLCIVEEPLLVENIDSNPKNQETLLVDSALAVFTVLVYEDDALSYIKKTKPVEIFQKLISTRCETIVLNAYMMLAYTMNERDIKRADVDLSLLTVTILNLLHNAIESSQHTNTENFDRDKIQLVEILKGLSKNEKVKKEIIRKKALPFLIECSKKLKGLSKQFMLECIWTLSFNQDVAKEIRENSEFMSALKAIPKPVANVNQDNSLRYSHSFSRRRNSTVIPPDEIANDGIYNMADGLLWNLEKKSELPDKKQKSKDDTNQTYNYDAMISYSFNDKEIVYKIQQFLVSEGYNVWFERENPRRKTIDIQAEAIDNSAVTILCMSSSYKQDNQCQAIAHHAFNAKRIIIPLLVHKGSRINGWLKSIVGICTTIDFATADFEASCSVLLQEMNEHVKKNLPDVPKKAITPVNIEKIRHPATPPLSPRRQPPPPPLPPRPPSQKSTVEYVISRPSTPGTGTVIVDRIQKIPVHTSPRPTTPGKLPVLSILSVVNAADQIVLPEEFLRRDTKDSAYHTNLIINWKRKEILDYLYDKNLHIMMPICESMAGRGLLRFFQMCQEKPSRLYSQINDELRARFKNLTLPMGLYTRFLTEIDNLIESIAELIPALSRPLSSQLQLVYMGDKSEQPATPLQFKNEIGRHATGTPNGRVPIFTPVQFTQEPITAQNAKVTEPLVFKPVTAKNQPYNFVVESSEEPAEVLKKIEFYAPQLLFMEQMSHEQHQVNGFH